MLLVLLCLAVPLIAVPVPDQSTPAHYTDDYARNKVYPIICSADFMINAQECVSKFWGGVTIKGAAKSHCPLNGSEHCRCVTGVSTTDKTIFMTFQGTSSPVQLVAEVQDTMFREKMQWPSGGNVSAYFGMAFMDLWNAGLKDDIFFLESQYPGYTLLVTGHSLGGALASLAASYVVSQKIHPAATTQLMTIGQPRTGDIYYAAGVDALLPYVYRIVHHKDVFPHLPTNGLEEYHHHHNEIWYNNDMSTADYKECDADDSVECSDGQKDLSQADHLTYFNWDYITKGCPQKN